MCVQHEQASVVMFDHLVASNNLQHELTCYGLMENDIIFIKEQIAGPRQGSSQNTAWPYNGRPEEKSFLYEVSVLSVKWVCGGCVKALV